MDEATRGRTTLIAAHSTELLAWADRIIDVTSAAAEVSGSAPTVATA